MLKYTKIDHQAKMGLGLSFIEYSIADSIYQLSTNPRAKNRGWCSASKQYLGDFIGVSREHVSRVIKKLIDLDILEKKSEKSKLIRTTSKWYESVIDSSKSVTFDHTTKSKCDNLSRKSVTSDHENCDNLSHPSNTNNNNNDIDRSLLLKSIENKIGELTEEMSSDQMHLEVICINNRLEIDHVKGLIKPWAKENASTSFQSTNHKRNSFRKFVLNSQMKVSHNSGGGFIRGSKPMLKPGEVRRNVG